LEYHPELARKVQFWAFLQPSRQDVEAYRDYLRKVRTTAHRINRKYGGNGWSPIRLEFGESVRKAMAALRNFDDLLVNPVYDGLNLISKEGALVNRNSGVIVPSENAGARDLVIRRFARGPMFGVRSIHRQAQPTSQREARGL